MAELRNAIIKASNTLSMEKESRLFEKSVKAWNISQSYLDTMKPAIIRRHNMYNSIHDVEEQYADKSYQRNKHYVPKTHEFVKNSVAQVVQAYFLNQDYVYLTPEVTDDIVSVMSAEYFTYIINKRLKNNANWLTFIQVLAQSGFMHNMCIAKVDWSVEEKQSTLIPISIENFRVDPKCDPLNPVGTSAFLIHRFEMYVDDLKAKQEEDGWLSIDVEDLQGNFVNTESGTDDIKASRNKTGTVQENGHGSVSNDLEKVYVHENIIRENNKYFVFFTLGTTKMLTKVFPLDELYPTGIPFVMSPIYPEELKVYATSPLDHAYQSQVFINKYTNTVMDAVEQVTWPVTIIKANSGIDPKKFQNVGPNSVVEARNPTQDILQLNKSIAPQSLKNEIPFLMNNYDSTVGGLANSTLSSEGNDSTATSQSMRGRSQSQVINMYLINFNEKVIEVCLHKMVAQEKYFGLKNTKEVEKVFRNLKLLDRFSEKLKTSNIDPSNFEIDKEFADADLLLSVNVGMGAVSPQLRVEQFLASLNALRNLIPNIESQLDVKEVIKELMSLNGYKEFNRFFTSQDDPRIGQLEKSIQDLQTKLSQKKSQEEINADIALKMAQKANVEANTVATVVGTQKTALEAANELAINPEIASGADKVMENAGFIDPTPNDPIFQ